MYVYVWQTAKNKKHPIVCESYRQQHIFWTDENGNWSKCRSNAKLLAKLSNPVQPRSKRGEKELCECGLLEHKFVTDACPFGFQTVDKLQLH